MRLLFVDILIRLPTLELVLEVSNRTTSLSLRYHHIITAADRLISTIESYATQFDRYFFVTEAQHAA